MSNEASTGMDGLANELQILSMSKARREVAGDMRVLKKDLSHERKLRKAAEKAILDVVKREAAVKKAEERMKANDRRDLSAIKVREANLARAEKELVHFVDQFEAIKGDLVETKVTTRTVKSFVKGTQTGGWYKYPTVNASALASLKRRVHKAEDVRRAA